VDAEIEAEAANDNNNDEDTMLSQTLMLIP
jgi:hypothetical protein